MLAKKCLGNWGEDRAALYMRKKGYQLIARQWRHGRYELDLIFYYPGLIVAVEVKTRSQNYNSNTPLLSSDQVKRLRLALLSFCRQKGHLYRQSRLDLITLTKNPDRIFTLRHYPDI